MPDEEQDRTLTLMMSEISAKLQVILDKHEELAENVSRIKEAVYNPDEGLYARLRDLEVRITGVEKWKDTNTKILWIIVTATTGLLVKALWASLGLS